MKIVILPILILIFTLNYSQKRNFQIFQFEKKYSKKTSEISRGHFLMHRITQIYFFFTFPLFNK